MKFKTISKEELEILPFDDIAYIILKDQGNPVSKNEILNLLKKEKSMCKII